MIITQSIIKKLFNHDERLYPCPHWFLRQVLNRDFPESPEQLEVYEGGNYFEYLVLGRNRDGGATIDMKRKKLTKDQIKENLRREAESKQLLLGEKSVKQERIELQAKMFPQLCSKYQVNIIKEVNTQIFVKKKIRDNLFLELTMDVFPTTILTSQGIRLAIMDTKLSGDINSTFGDYQWGDPSRIDYIQAMTYTYGVRDIDFNLNPHLEGILTPSILKMIQDRDFVFVYWIFDTNANKLGHKFVPFYPSITHETSLLEKIRRTEQAIIEMANNGWKKEPKYKLCKKCPVSVLNGGDCRDYSEFDE